VDCGITGRDELLRTAIGPVAHRRMNRTQTTVCGAALAAVIASGAGCECLDRLRHRPPNVIVVTIDTVRADHCSAYGYALETTPNLDRLGREGVRFEDVYAPMPTTSPSHASMFTSHYPASHGVLKNGFVLDPRFVTLAEALAARGYDTAAFVAAYVVDHKFGFGQGFALYDDDFRGAQSTVPGKTWQGHDVSEGFDRRADEVASRAAAWLERRRDGARPFFLWVHFYDPHWPYVPPELYRSRFRASAAGGIEGDVALYDGEIAFADAKLGELLDRLERAGLAANTLVIATSDHGEGLGQHGHRQHGLLLYEEAVRVPLVLRWPDRLSRGQTVAGPVELVDLMPTILDLVGVPRQGMRLQGRSLVPVLQGGKAADPARLVVMQRRQFDTRNIEGRSVKGPKFAVRADRWKYIEAPEEGTKELYDLAADPREIENVADQFPAEVRSLASELGTWRQAHASSAPEQTLSEHDVEALKSLGYVR
jgi:arylsulfatase A-like enzyme